MRTWKRSVAVGKKRTKRTRNTRPEPATGQSKQ
jgi:hypothetical protein